MPLSFLNLLGQNAVSRRHCLRPPHVSVESPPIMLERWFQLAAHQTTVARELTAGCVTFLTMAYIIVVQPALLAGVGMDAAAAVTATCLASAAATALMAIYARYPVALAPGMGENFFFVSVCSAPAVIAAAGGEPPWQAALAIVFASGVLFMLITFTGIRRWLLESISPSLKHAMAAGIGLFIASIGLKQIGLIVDQPGALVGLTHRLATPDMLVFFIGLCLTVVLAARRVRGAIIWGILGAALAAAALRWSFDNVLRDWSEMPAVAQSALMTRWRWPDAVLSLPPSPAPVWMQMQWSALLHAAVWPLVIVFLFMDLFDTMGTLVAVAEHAGLMKDGRLPRVGRALLADASGTSLGAMLGMSTVTSFIESAAGVEAGGRTGLTALMTAALFLVAMFFSPIITVLGAYAPLTAPAIVYVGSLMTRSLARIEWNDPTESLPAFIVVLGIPFFSSIADGIGLGLIGYAVVKPLAGRSRDVHPLLYVLAALLIGYFALLR